MAQITLNISDEVLQQVKETFEEEMGDCEVLDPLKLLTMLLESATGSAAGVRDFVTNDLEDIFVSGAGFQECYKTDGVVKFND